MKKIICLLAALLPITVFASGGPDRHNDEYQPGVEQGQAQGQLQGQAQGQIQGQGQSQGNFNAVDVSNDVRNTATAGSISGSLSGSSSEATSSQEQSAVAEQSQSANNEGNVQSITFNQPATVTTHQRGTAELRTVPTAIAPNIYPTANCAMSASVGASTLGTGVSFGGTKVNHECVMLETARVYSQLGYPVQGLDILCSTPVSLEVFGTKEACLAAGVRAETPEQLPSVVVLPATGISREQVTEQIDRAFKTAVAK